MCLLAARFLARKWDEMKLKVQGDLGGVATRMNQEIWAEAEKSYPSQRLEAFHPLNICELIFQSWVNSAFLQLILNQHYRMEQEEENLPWDLSSEEEY